MKKLFVSILALAAFAACQSNFNDVDYDTPEFGGVENVGGSHTIYAEVGVGKETKATYGDDLEALWEDGDQIALLQEHADYGKTFSATNKIGIKSGVGTNYASFSGDISVDSTDPRIYHIVYPGSAASFNVTMSQSVEGVSYEEGGSLAMWQYRASGYAVCTYNSTVNVVVPTSQSGKWEPYLYASTDEAVKSEAIGAKTLNTLTGAIAIRAYEADGTTPKQLKSIAVTATKPIAGAFSGSAQSVGNTVNVTGDWGEDEIIGGDSYENKAKQSALNNLTSKLQGYEATTTSVTKALSLSFVGTEYTVKADDTAWVAADENGVYTYHLNVAPFEGADLTITATAVDGSTLVRTISGQSLAAAHRKGYNFKWESAAFGYEAIHTWYDNYQNSPFTLASNTIHIGGVKVTGSVTEQNVTAIGVRIYNEADESLYTEVVESNKLSFAKDVSGIPSGRYIVKVFADVVVNGVATTKEFSETKIVTAIPDFAESSYVRSSYSYNGGVNLDNSVGGGDLRVKVVLNDAYLAANLVETTTFYYNSASKTIAVGSEDNTSFDYNGWGQYDCYVKLVFGNGYVIEGLAHTAHVTGIPYTMNVTSNDGSWSVGGDSGADTSRVNWNTDGGVRLGKNQVSDNIYITNDKFHIPANVTVKVTANGIHNGTGSSIFAVKNKVTLTVGSSTVVEHEQNGKTEAAFSCNAAQASMSSSSKTVKLNSKYNASGAKVVLKSLRIEF